MNTLYQKLKEKEKLRGNVEPLERLFEETWIGQPVPWSVKELSIEDEAVILGEENLPDGERTRVPEEEFQNWIDNYRGIDREYYLAGGGLLLVGFLLQIVSRSASINIWAGVTVLLLTLGVGIYLLCRGKDYVWWFSG